MRNPPLETLMAVVNELLDVLVLVRDEDGFHLLGGRPPWVQKLGFTGPMPPSMPVLDVFVEEAEAFWAEQRDGRVRSPYWTERQGDELFHLAATALRFGELRLLLITREEQAFNAQRRLAQLGRDAVLSREQLSVEVERKEVLVHMVVHDLAAPVNATLATLELLEERLADDHHARALVSTAKRAALRQDQLVREILDAFVAEREAMGRVERSPDRAPELGRTARRVVDLFAPVAARSGLSVESSIEGDGLQVAAESSRLERVLTNLVENALRHSPAGGQVLVEVVARDDEVEARVTDQGPGVAPAEVPRLFEKFTQGQHRGRTGLGLYFCALTVHRWGGEIGYRALPDASCFWFRLPRVRAEQ